jgi:hypothetical protein
MSFFKEDSVRNAVGYVFYAEPDADRMFDRWLAKVKADALRETADFLDAMQTRDGGYPRDLPLIIHERADVIEERA